VRARFRRGFSPAATRLIAIAGRFAG